MPSLRTGRLASPALKFFALFLCAAAFAWGLEVRLSDYSSARVHDKIINKLVHDSRADNEPSAKKFSVLGPTHSSAPLLSALIAVALVAPRFAAPEIPPHAPLAPSVAASPLTLFSRPPPQNS